MYKICLPRKVEYKGQIMAFKTLSEPFRFTNGANMTLISSNLKYIMTLLTFIYLLVNKTLFRIKIAFTKLLAYYFTADKPSSIKKI